MKASLTLALALVLALVLLDISNAAETVRKAENRPGVTLHVSKLGDNSDGSSWAKAFKTIQAALHAVPDAHGGHRIIVRPDTYLEANLFPAHKGAAGAYNLLVGDFDGSLGSGTTGWVVLDSGDAAKGFKSYDWWGPIRAYKQGWSKEHKAETFSAVGWDRWTFRHFYASGGDAGLFFDLVDKAELFTVVVEDCVSIGRAFGGGVANVLSRPNEPTVFRRCKLWCLDWWGDAAGAYIRAEHPEMPEHPDVLFENCTLAGPDNALQAGNPGYSGHTRVKLRNCRLVSFNFSQPQGKPGTGIIHSTIDGQLLHVDLEDCTLMGCKVFGAGKGEVGYATTGEVKAYVQFQQEVPKGMHRLGHWPVDVFQTILPSAPPTRDIPAENKPPATSPNTDGRMKLLSKEVFIRHQNKRPPVTGFITYVHKTKPVLMHCHGWEDYSDGYDDYAVSLSHDNGKTWSAEQVRWKSKVVSEGRIRYGEPAAFFDSDKEKLIVLVDKTLYPNDKLNVDTDYGLELNIYDPKKRKWTERRELQFPGHRTPAMSFSFPIKTARGHLLFPGMRKTVNASGTAVHYKGTWAPVDEVVTVIGEWASNGELEWRLGKALNIAPEISSRGLDENALVELPDGRIAAICRGDNSAFPEKPGYKWLSFSSDDGETWSAPGPLPATGGEAIESGANGSALFRSIKNGKLYWMGNLALRGERAKDNWPRSPLVIVEVQETPFALKHETIFAVDERTYNDSPRVQMSNFRFYQDRETGDVVIFLTRYGEVSEKDWMLANYYRYRLEMP